MKKHQSDVWVGVADRTNDPALHEQTNSEFFELPIAESLAKEESSTDLKANRRDFLKYVGFGLGAATIAASCDTPVRRAIPYVVKPDAIVPGVATYYASTFVQGGDYCPVLVKTREGRPIKIEGNSLSPITNGGTSARAQASVLSLYDTYRLKNAGKVVDGKIEEMSWADLDKAVKGAINSGSNIRVVTNTLMSPTAKKAIAEFAAKYPNTKVVTYDPVSSSAMLDANMDCFGQRVVPNYRFDEADVIVSFGADFLGTWISPVEYASQYASKRKIEDTANAKMSRHIQVEAGMSLTGSNADNRILIKPSQQGASIAALYNEIASSTGGQSVNAPKLDAAIAGKIKKAAADLLNAKGASLVVSGSNNVGEQTLINAINSMLGNVGKTVRFDAVSYQRQGKDQDIQGLISEMNGGGVDAVFVYQANPAFDLPNSDKFAEAYAKVGTRVAMGEKMTETVAISTHSAPTNHFLESWSDVEAKKGHYTLVQPTISPIFKTRQMSESLLVWADSPNYDASAEQPCHDYLKKHWQEAIFPQQSTYASFQTFWDSALHDGVFNNAPAATEVGFSGDVSAAAGKINKPSSSELEIEFTESVNIGNGYYADNPWLQEMPDPITRCVWGNYLTVPISFDGVNKFNGFKGIGKRNLKGKGDIVEVEVGGVSKQVVATPSFGQTNNTVSLGLGYGREVVGKTGENVGQNVYPWCDIDANGNTMYYAANANVSDIVAEEEEFACVQYHHTMGITGMDTEVNEVVNVDEKALGYKGYQGSLTERSIIRQGHVDNIEQFTADLKHEREHHQKLNSHTLYPYQEYNRDVYSLGHHWGMYVDLNACVGCGACTVACMSENNVPVVGKREVHRHHEMTWLRIDRYFYGDAENPNVVYQPMMCQHCDNAPCENVCPVAATNHSSEGINQMAYNRCIGTRYCANNCPYKVRRFNWLDYTTADLFPGNQPTVNGEEVPFGADNLTRMVLNPDVTVRSRGVIEKCSFCVQRIQEAKLTAKREQRKLQDGDVKTACQTSCPTGAIVFGDMNDKTSRISQKLRSPLAYRALEEVNVQSSVTYSAKINNRSEALDA